MKYDAWKKQGKQANTYRKKQNKLKTPVEKAAKGLLKAGMYQPPASIIADGKLQWHLKRHLGSVAHSQATSARDVEEADHARDVADTPTDAQMFFVYDEVKKNPMEATGKQYVKRCLDARSSGDLKNVPPVRCSRDIFYKALRSEGDAVLDHVHAKLTNKKNPLKAMCWSEDAAKTWEQMVCRAVFKDRSWEDLLIKWHNHRGQKTGLEKSHAVEQVKNEFAKGRPEVLKSFEKCFEWLTDGERSEPLAAVFTKVQKVLPLRHAGRCGMHSKQKNMENATATDELLEEILDLLIRNYSDEKSLGGLCRAVKNRDRHRMNLHADIEEQLDQLVKDLEAIGELWDGPEQMPTGRHSLSSAPQRFDSLLTGLRTIALNIRGIILFLAKLGGAWAQTLLNLFMRPEFEAALPLLCEYLEIGRTYVHREEGHDPDKCNLINSYSDFLHMKKELMLMFAGGDGQPPKCAWKEYTKGYYQLMKKSLNSLGDDVCYRAADGDVRYHRKFQSEDEEVTVLALIMKRMQHVCEVFLAACEVDLLMARAAALAKSAKQHCCPGRTTTTTTKQSFQWHIALVKSIDSIEADSIQAALLIC